MSTPHALASAFAPTGRLRAALNLGNPLLAAREPATGRPAGVSVDLAQALADRLGIDLALVPFDTAAESVQAVAGEACDLGFFAIDPARAASIAFSAPYLLIQGAYLVRDDSPLRVAEDVDRPGLRVVVGAGSAYHLHLSRTLERAELVRAPSSPRVVETFLFEGADVAAGVRQQLEAEARERSGLRMLDGHFMLIRQALGIPLGRGEDARQLLHGFVEDMKANGFVARSLQRHQVDGIALAPAEALAATGPAAPHAG